MGKLLSWTQMLRRQTGAAITLRRARRSGRWLRASGIALTDLVFPPRCLLCGSDMQTARLGLCQQCRQDLLSSSNCYCPRCAKPVPSGTSADEDGCALCANKRFRFQRTMAVGIYGDTIRELVLRMKQSRHESLSLAAGGLLAEKVEQVMGKALPDVVAPVPMHWLRRLSRGINAAELLAETIAKQLHRPLHLGLLRCRRRTKKQGTLLPKERRRNVRGAYATTRRASLQGLHVLLVDDVMTTGATANELAKVLVRGGAREVSVAVIARGVGFD